MWDEAEEYTFNGLKMRRVFETPVKMWEDAKTQSWQSITGTEDLHWCKRVVDNDVFRKAGWPAFAKKPHPFLCDTTLFCRHIDPAGHQYPANGEDKAFARPITTPKRGANRG
jgi:hypothetical protein